MRWLTILLMSLTLNVWAKSNSLHFENYIRTDDSSHHQVYGVVEDKYGVMWLATNNGLGRYDGREFKIYQYQADAQGSIGANFVWTVFIDSRERLWVGTHGGGINRFEFSTESFIRYYNQPRDGDGKDNVRNIRAITEGPKGNIWIATDNGLNRLNVETGLFKRFLHRKDDDNSLVHNWTRTLAFDLLGRLWIGTWDGISLFDINTEQFTHVRAKPNDINALSNGIILAFYFDQQDRLWIGTNNGLNRLDTWREFPRQKPQFSRFNYLADNSSSLSHNQVWSIAQNSAGQLWFGTRNGINRWLDDGRFERMELAVGNGKVVLTGTVMDIYEDQRQNLWFAANSGIGKVVEN